MPYEIVEKLKRQIDGFRDEVKFETVGRVIECGDGIAKIHGLKNALSQELLSIKTESGEIAALVFNLEEDSIGAVLLDEAEKVKVGDRVHSTGRVLSIKVGPELIGRVINPLGEPLDAKGVIFADPSQAQDYLLERNAPSVLDRQAVKTPLHTGIKAVDAMIPIGRGQRELIIGDRQTGKTALALDTIINQKNDAGPGESDQVGRPPVVCVYVAIGQKNSKIAQMVKVLESHGALDYTVVIAAPASSPATVQYLAPFTGCAVGEFFMDQGRDAVVIYDDLSKHADAYRQLSLLLRRPPGREAYPGDIFYLHARLLERAAKLNRQKGGGSLTALPIIETKLDDVSAYIPTNVISITDGQIYLRSNLFHQGVRPAVDVGLSISRVGSAAQTPAMKKVAGRLRLELAQFRELAAFVQFASDLDEATRAKIKHGQLLTEALKQSDLNPVPLEYQVPLIYAAIKGLLDDIKIEKIDEFEKKFSQYLEARWREKVLEPIKQDGTLTDEIETALVSAINEFKSIANLTPKPYPIP
ncbi:MAG: F0F1 ATP synthase subunit alpha [Parcubacteria group bacterium]|nr:F0F1 ATP synthase subunit alpha [Parcubacteria group bacterium]